MRRIIAAALLALMLCHSSGIGLAAQTPSTHAASLSTQVAAMIQPVFSIVQSSQILAILEGRRGRYAAMHAPPPDFSAIPRKRLVDPRDTHVSHAVAARAIGFGTLLHPQMRDIRTINFKNPPKDPLATGGGAPRRTLAPIAPLSSVSDVTKPAATASRRAARVQMAGTRTAMSVDTSSPGMTGINPWWTYEEGAIPAAGKWMANVANGNLIVQSDDVDIPGRGIDLAFRRTYNLSSQHTYANTDGSVASNYGDGWTNTFDAHMGYDTTRNELSVYDIDGARYDYCANNGAWSSCTPGQHATLTFDGGCGYYWTKKIGTVYHFYSTNYSGCAGSANFAGYNGRLYYILGRNHNNWIRFDYSWDNGIADGATHLAKIAAVHADGQQLTLQFANFSGYRLLYSVTRPDNQSIVYAYDATADVTDVCDVGNGNADNSSGAASICGNTNHRHHAYGWYSNHQIKWASSPKWTMYSGGPDATASGGTYVVFAFDSSSRLHQAYYDGYTNFKPNDGTGTLIQPNVADSTNNPQVYKNEFFTYNSGNTAFTDTDLHATTWYYDPSNRVTQTHEYTGSTENTWLITGVAWDGNNNVVAADDARGNETDYGYDSMGNTLWVDQPAVPTNVGTIHPIARYAYDNYNNLIAYCDPVYVYQTGVTTCPTAAGATYYKYDYSDTTNEPYGRLSDSYTPIGFHKLYSYGSNGQQGQQWGLVTDVNADCFTQLDGTSNCGHLGFSYDAYGNMTYYGPGIGNWTLSYDSLDRMTSATDPDDVTSRTCYNGDNSVSAKESAYQYYLDGNTLCGSHSEQFTYDADGNELSETHHYGQTTTNGVAAGTTQKWYDGADRLVEVLLPSDKYTDNSVAERSRYVYDLTQGGFVQITGTNQSPSFRAYGNLYKTQRFLLVNNSGAWTLASAATDINGNAFDGLDRSVARYQYSPGNGLEQWSSAYDSGLYQGLLTSTTDPLTGVATYSYDALNREAGISFNDGATPSRSYTYDPDGRTASVTSSSLGTESYQYDIDGHQIQHSEGAGSGASSPATLSYAYYPNGQRKSMSVSSAALNQTNEFAYNYRVDGLRSSLEVSGQANPFTWTYSNAGRQLTQTDPLVGAAINKASTYQTTQPAFNSYSVVTRSQSFDAYGQLASLELPDHGRYASIGHDVEGNIVGFAMNGDNVALPTGGNYVSQVQLDYDVRNEQSSSEGFYPGMNAFEPLATGTVLYGHGCSFAYQPGAATPTSDCAGSLVNYGTYHRVVGSATVDSTTGATLTGSATYDTKQSANCSNLNASSVSGVQYDVGGRQSAEMLSTMNYNCVWQLATPVQTRSYDAENHITADTCTGASGGDGVTTPACLDSTGNIRPPGTYAWNAVGKLRIVTGGSGPVGGTLTLHWDDDQLLFISDSSGKLVQLNVEMLAIATNQLWVLDRDFAGTQVAYHGNGSDSPWTYGIFKVYQLGKAPPKMTGACVSCPPAADPQPDFADTFAASMVREDGYQVRGLTIQGVRAFDSSSQQWTTPDAYKGDVRDPMSQRGYMWNDNNPIAYSDPSGYSACSGVVSCGIDFGIKAITEGAKTISRGAIAVAPKAASGIALGTAGAVSGVLGVVATVLTPLATADGSEHVDEKETRSTDEQELKEHGIDAHQVKGETIGKKEVSKYDLRVDKKTGELAAFRKGAKIGVRTGYFIGK